MADFEGTKELNFDENIGLEELGRLRLENRDLQLTREKLVKKLDKKKNELEIERTNATTLRQFIQELNRKVELLEREPIPVINPLRIDPGAGLTGEVVERLVMEKTGLESNLEEQKTEIETLKSEITSMNTRLVLTNQNLEIVRGENDRFEKLVPELKLELSKMENECIRMSMSTNSEDKTIETDTLKTRLQDLSITNKHYLSQLQKKDLTIATTTNKFDTEKQQILELSRLEIEKLKQNETSLNEQLIKVKRELDKKCSGLEDDKSVLEIQVDVLNGQIGELSEERERWRGRVVELETTLTDLQLQLQKLGEVQQNETATVQKYEQQITELTNQITILNNELTSVKDSALVRKQLITKLNHDIEVLETNKDNIQQRLNDKTSETETLKTRLQDLSITNKLYLSQLQKKDLTIATTTNKFETEKQQILELSRLEIEKLKQNETSLSEQLIKVKRELDQKCSALEDDKSVLEIQVDVLNGQIGELSEERERWKGRVVELETTLTDLQLQLRKLGEVQQNETATVQNYEQQITELTNQITILNNELTSVKDSALVSKQLINKLNHDIEVLETNKDTIQQRLNDKTSETETLKTRVQDLSITNKLYLSQLQKKDLTIATTTNKFETEKQQILERSRLEIEKLKQNETSLSEQLIKVKRELDQKCSALEDDKSVLEIQVDVLNGQIGELSEERERWKGRVVELETTLTDLQLQLRKLGEVQQNETATVQNYEQQITELTNQITILNNELTSVKDSALVSKQLINKLNHDIEVLETNKDTIQQRLNDKTSETETLKTRVQDLSITNKLYLSQLQKKDLTIATTTNKFETEKQQILERSRLEIEKLKQNETSLNEQLIKVKRELDQKCSVEIQELTVNNNNIKSEKEKCKHELAKLDNQIIELMTELSSIRVYGREEEVKLSQEIEELKNEIHTLRATPGHNSQGAGESNERVGVLEVTIAELKGKETENKLKIKELRNENDSFEKENSDLKSEKMILKEQNIDLKESNLMYEKQIDELTKQQQQQPDGDANMELTSQLEAAKQQEFNNETEIWELKQEQDTNLILLQQKEETITTTTNELEQTKQNETSLNEQLITANAELEELYRHSQDKKKTDQEILTLSTDNSHLIQQLACLEGDNAKLQEEFDRKPSKQELIAQLDDTQNKVMELLRKCNPLQKTKNEIEDTLQTELKESRDEVFLLKTETNQQKETINTRNEVIETYKQQQISHRYHYPDQGPSSLPTHSIGPITKPPVIEKPWKWTFCGDTYPSERERKIHMTDSCNNAPTRDAYTTHLNMASNATKVILLWSKERPTFERQLTYFDNSQFSSIVLLKWSIEQSLYQGNGTLAVGKHHGSLLFPSSGAMVQVQPFEVVRKLKRMFRVKLKLYDPQAQENVQVENLDTDQDDRNSDQIDTLRAELQEPVTKSLSTLIPQANKAGKSPSNMYFRGVSIHVVKLKVYPNPLECCNKQVICSINECFELGVLMCIKVGLSHLLPKYAGIDLYNPVGNCDGTHKDKRYFDCSPNCGIFVPIGDVYVPVP